MYAIRHKPTGYYLPNRWTWRPRAPRGFTYDEPAPIDERPPRLFASARDANNALTCWVKGKWWMDHEDGYGGIQAVPGRSRADMEVIPVAVVPL